MGQLIMDKVKIGAIGAGGLAFGIHLPILAKLKTVELTAVCDWNFDLAQKACRQFSMGKAYVSHLEMLERENLDAVFVLTQPDMLFRPVVDCLKAGLHVFMEKPMGITLFQANTLKRLADQENRYLQVGFNRRTIPLVTVMVKRMRELTEITHIEGRFYKNSSASFYDGCASAFVCDVIHVIDLVRYLASGNVQKALMLEESHSEEGVVQAWHSVISFDNGVTGAIRANYKAGGRIHDFELHGPGASAFINLGFGEAGCSGKILYSNGGSHSLSSAGNPEVQIEEFDGIEIAESDDYGHYYGYFDEDNQFIDRVKNHPNQGDPQRTKEDYKTMELVQLLLDTCK